MIIGGLGRLGLIHSALDDPFPEGMIAVGFIVSWTPKVCKIMALMAVIMGVGPLFYILLGFIVCGLGTLELPGRTDLNWHPILDHQLEHGVM